MIFIFRKKYSSKLKVYKILKSIYGIGSTKTNLFLLKLGITMRTTLFNLKRFRAIKLNRKLNLLKFKLKAFVKSKELKVHMNRINIGSYKSIRLLSGLPLNGQRTKTNAKTSKRSVRITKSLNYYINKAIAYKKKLKQKLKEKKKQESNNPNKRLIKLLNNKKNLKAKKKKAKKKKAKKK